MIDSWCTAIDRSLNAKVLIDDNPRYAIECADVVTLVPELKEIKKQSPEKYKSTITLVQNSKKCATKGIVLTYIWRLKWYLVVNLGTYLTFS